MTIGLAASLGACSLDRSGTALDLRSTGQGGAAQQGVGGASLIAVTANSSSAAQGGGSSSSGSGGDASAWLGSFGHRKLVTIAATDVVTTLWDFVIPVVRTDPDLASGAQADGDDIVFAMLDGTTRLAHELVRFNDQSGALVAWVKLPHLIANDDTLFYMYYGDAYVEDISSTQTWSADYRSVWHMEEDPSLGTKGDVKDSTATANHLSPKGNFESTDLWDGIIGYSIDIDVGNNSYLETVKNVGIKEAQPRTVSMWVLPNDNPDEGGFGRSLICWGPANQNSQANFLYYNSDEQTFELGYWGNDGQTPGNFPKDKWYHVATTYDGGTDRIYVDGVEVTSRAVGVIDTTDDKAQIGLDTFGQGRYLNARVDEVHLAYAARSAGWIATEYRSQHDSEAFLSFGPQQDAP